MRICEILADDAVQQPTSTKFQSLDTIAKDPNTLVNVWGPRLTQLQSRCNAMLSTLIKTAGAKWSSQLTGTSVTVQSNDQYIQADAQTRKVSVDLTVFWDAPDATLAFAIAHELGHIALGHIDDVANIAPAQSRKDELDADNFGVSLAKSLGYNAAQVFKFMNSKEELDQQDRQTRLPNSTHPSNAQRIQRAQQQGFKLSKGGQQQMDVLQQHLA